MIKDRNVDPNAQFVKETVNLRINAGASLAGVIQDGWRAPYPGKILSAHLYCATLTDADDTVRADLKKGSTSLLSATVDPVAADTLTALTLTDDEFDEGDVLKSLATTGVGDAFVGGITLIVRPYVGYVERQAAKNAGESLTV